MFPKLEQDNRLPFLSVVIPTLNREKYLEKCLTSLFKIDYPKANFEVIVVDGGSNDGTMVMVQRKFPEVKFILERRKGRSYARNTGWKQANGQIVVYTDDDCVLDRSWLRVLASGFDSKEIGGVGGPLLLLLHPKSICEKFWGDTCRELLLGK